MDKKIILFDLGNVFLKPIHGEIIKMLFENKKNNIDYDDYKRDVALILNDSFEGKISLEETWEKLFKIVNIKEEKDDIVKGFKVIRNEELIKYVSAALVGKYEIGILSDLSQIGYSVFKNHYNDLYNMCDKDKVFVSVNTGKTKSKDGINYFNEVINKLKVKPSDVIFIDDEILNIENANAVKLNTILFESHEYKWNVANEKMKEKLLKLGGET